MDLINQKYWFDSPEFEQKYHCDVPMGSFCAPDGTTFHLWAPTAEKVVLYLYDDGAKGAPLDVFQMEPQANGLWVYATSRNLDGFYYDYDVTVDGVRRRTADPYAKACGLNGKRSMVLNLRRTDPAGWQEDTAPAGRPDDVI